MIGFQATSLRQDAFRILLIEVIGQHHQGRTDTLTTQRQDVTNRLVKTRWLTVIRHFINIAVDELQDFVGCFHILNTIGIDIMVRHTLP